MALVPLDWIVFVPPLLTSTPLWIVSALPPRSAVTPLPEMSRALIEVAAVSDELPVSLTLVPLLPFRLLP